MISAGVDIGSTTTKCVVLNDHTIMASIVLPSGNMPGQTAVRALNEAMAQAGVKEADVQIIATTGYGRRMIDLGDVVMTEIKACAAGVRFRPAPDGPIHTIIDVGGQDTKVLAIDDDGEIEDFSMNDKCAAGTGRFLEMLAHKLDMTYEQFVEEARRSDTMIQMNSTCAVFAESEVVGLLARNVPRADIAAAAHNSIAQRIASMTRRVGRRGGYCFVGGGAKNATLVAAVQENINKPVYVPPDAQVVTALGAAVCAAQRYGKAAEKEDA